MSTDLVLPDQNTPGVDLAVWAEQARSAAVYAEAVCSTQMAPAAYRGKPAEATAAILAGAELGFSPMASLRAFDNIQGVPAPKAMTLRAVVLAQGHKVVIEESTGERATVRARRRDDDEWQVCSWDLDRARRMGLLEKDQWKKQPQAMLVARATAEVCRWIASDAIMGMPYAAEEIQDERIIEAAPAVRRLTAADLAEPQPAIDQVAAAEPVSRAQQQAMFALWDKLGYSGDENRATRLGLTAKFIGAEAIESSDDLTWAEAEIVLSKLRERQARVEAGGEQ